MTLTLQEAIAEVKLWEERGRYWPGAPDPANVSDVILNAAASGALVPASDALAEIEALRAERDEYREAFERDNADLAAALLKLEAAEAEVVRLRALLTGARVWVGYAMLDGDRDAEDEAELIDAALQPTTQAQEGAG